MKLINTKNNQIIFTAETSESLANAIRKYFNQILVLAVDEVEISKNDSPLYDETIAHRIGLVPLKSKKNITEKTQAKLKLKAKQEGTIYSEELKGDAEIVYGKIPLTVLTKDQELELTATAKAGKASQHSKFSPGILFYRNLVDIKVDKNCPKEILGICPKNILKQEKISEEDQIKCDVCELCIEACKKQNKDYVKIIPTNELIITVESFGQFKPEEIFKKAVETLKKDLFDFSKEISKVK